MNADPAGIALITAIGWMVGKGRALLLPGSIIVPVAFVQLIAQDAEASLVAAPSPREVTQLLLAWSNGDQEALEKLIPLVYNELRRLAHRYMKREHPGHTLQTTALVHEAYQRLIDSKNVRWQNRAHFFAVSAQLMRRILVDFARSRRYRRRGGEWRRVSLDEALAAPQDRRVDIVALDDALRALAALDPRKGRIVEMRFFGGLSVEETAGVLKVSPETVLRDWRLAKAWLLQQLSRGAGDGA